MKFRIAERAQGDIEACLEWSLSEFGQAAFERYGRLIQAAVLDVAHDPARHGSREIEVFSGGPYRLYHLRHSRASVGPESMVKTPRHFLAFRVVSGETVEIVRLLHDSMDIESRLSSLAKP